jgi:hypothetical protein
MDPLNFSTPAIAAVMAIILPIVFLLATRIGDAIARRSTSKLTDHPHFGVIQGAILSILGLLLGFGFSGAMGRFVDRQDLIVQEANALGTFALRLDLLSPEARGDLRALTREYTQARLELVRGEQQMNLESLQRIQSLQSQLWTRTIAAVEERPATMMPLLSPLNEVLDVFSKRQAATRRHTPPLVIAGMLLCAVAAAMVVGYCSPRDVARLRMPALLLGVLIALVVWITIDLDYPRLGFIRVSDQPMIDVLESIGPARR